MFGASSTNHIEELMEKNLMHESGLKKIEAAQKDGSWNALDDVENLILPDDLLNCISCL